MRLQDAAPAPEPQALHRRLLLPATCLAVVLLGAWHLYRDALTHPVPLCDERSYISAWRLMAAGDDPYAEPAYLYPPAFARVGLAAEDLLGPWLLPVWRWSSLVGVAVLVWVSLWGNRWPLPVQGAVGLAVISSGITANGIGCNNVTLLVAGPLLLALRLSPRWPLAAALVAGTINSLKPMGLAGLAVQVTPRRGEPVLRRWAVRFTLATALVAVMWLRLGIEDLPLMMGKAGGFPHSRFNVSLHRALVSLGLPVPPAVVFLAAMAVAMAFAWRRVGSDRERMALAGVACLLGLPVTNPNSYLLSLPVQVLALELAAGRFAAAWRAGEGRKRPLAELALVSAATLSAHGPEGGLAAMALPLPVQGIVILIPALAVIGLTWYSVGRGGTRPERGEGAAAPAIAASRLAAGRGA